MQNRALRGLACDWPPNSALLWKASEPAEGPGPRFARARRGIFRASRTVSVSPQWANGRILRRHSRVCGVAEVANTYYRSSQHWRTRLIPHGSDNLISQLFRGGPDAYPRECSKVSRHFADYINRVAFRGESFILMRGNRPVAELRPVPVGTRLGDLPDLLASLPRLSRVDAEAFNEDLQSALDELAEGTVRDPWGS